MSIKGLAEHIRQGHKAIISEYELLHVYEHSRQWIDWHYLLHEAKNNSSNPFAPKDGHEHNWGGDKS